MLGRGRLAQWYTRVLRDDMLAAYGWAAELRAVDVSVVLQGATDASAETRYRAGALLEALTGQRPGAVAVANTAWEDPMRRRGAVLAGGTDGGRGELEAARRAVLARAAAAAKKGGPAASVAGEMRRLSAGSGTRLACTLRGALMYAFVERLREFALPDMVGGVLAEPHARMPARASDPPGLGTAHWMPETSGSPTGGAYRALRVLFEKRGGSVRTCHPPRYALTRTDDRDARLLEASACYLLRSSDAARFPDVEAHYEALAPVLGGESQTLSVLVRPLLRVSTPQDKEMLARHSRVDTLRVMNHLLANLFSPYLFRPHLD